MEAISAAFASFTQTSATGGQGGKKGQSNLQRFKMYHPSTFTGGGDPMEANHWF